MTNKTIYLISSYLIPVLTLLVIGFLGYMIFALFTKKHRAYIIEDCIYYATLTSILLLTCIVVKPAAYNKYVKEFPVGVQKQIRFSNNV